MMLKLMIADSRPNLLSVWSEVFSDIKESFFINTDARTLMSLPEIDAVLMISIFAHERYGGISRIGESQVLENKVDPMIPQWIVTTSPFAAHLEEKIAKRKRNRFEMIPDKKYSPEEESYILAKNAFKSIQNFNKRFEKSEINALGFHLGFLNYPMGEPRQEAEAVRKAYLEIFYGLVGKEE
jgi:hypothetical protein